MAPSSPHHIVSYVIHIYLVINGIKFGKDNAINEPRCLSHRMVSQGSVELDLERRNGSKYKKYWPKLGLEENLALALTS